MLETGSGCIQCFGNQVDGRVHGSRKNILELEENLQEKFRENRQSGITAELFDIVSGFEALNTP